MTQTHLFLFELHFITAMQTPMKYLTAFICSILCVLSITSLSLAATAPKSIGWIENVSVGQKPFILKAKMDTGAGTSSLHADIIKTYKKDGKDYVLYRIFNNEGASKTIRSIIRRNAKIKTKDGGTMDRPVVRLDVCIGNLHINEEVNLSDRTHMNYPVLIGRNMLAKYFVINPAKTFTTTPNCE